MRKNSIIPYREDLKTKARELRKNSTLSEVLLWVEIKERKLLGFQFHRQVPMLDFIVDFYCHELKLAIEIDGSSHNYKFDYDVKRQAAIELYGVRFIRFDDLEVKKNLQQVIRSLDAVLQEITDNLSNEENKFPALYKEGLGVVGSGIDNQSV